MKLTELAIKRPAFMAMIFTALAVFGIFSFSTMGVDLLPKMDWPGCMVSTPYPGAGPEEVETQVSKPTEEALSSLNGLKSIRTFSSEGFSFTWLEFNMSTDINQALNDVERKMNQVQSTFPKDALDSNVDKVDVNSAPILRIAVTSTTEQTRFYQFLKDQVKPRLEQVSGVSSVSIVGGKEREIRVEVDNDKLRHFNLSIDQVAQAISFENLDYPTGSIYQKERKFIVRVAGKYAALDDISNLILSSSATGTVYLKDVATVSNATIENYSLSRMNSSQCVGLIIQKASDANAVKTSDGVQKTLKKLEKLYANQNLKFKVAQDITQFTRRSVNSVKKDMLAAILMVAFVLFIFLHNAKNSLIVLLSIPVCIVTTFIVAKLLGFTINLITMMALTLVIGILVDDSIVVLENIHRHLEKGENNIKAAINGRTEIGLAAIAITLVDVVVFLPVAMLSGIVGKIFREFGLTIVTATLISLFVSFTLTPLLASRWSRVVELKGTNIVNRFALWFEGYEKKLSIYYKGILRWALNNRKRVLLISITALILSFMLVGFGLVGTEFMPQSDRGEFAINLKMPLGTGIMDTDRITHRVEGFVAAKKEVEQYYTVIGRKESSFYAETRSNISQIQVKLKDENKIPSQVIMNQLMKEIKAIPGVDVSIAQISMFGAADDKPIAIEVKGTNLEELVTASKIVEDIVKKTAGTRDVSSSWEEGQPEVKIKINREKCAYYHLTLSEVAQTMRTALEGNNDSKFKEGDTEYDIRVILTDKLRSQVENVKNINIMNHMGQMVPLSEVAYIYYGQGPNEISRKDRARTITISSDMNGSRPLGAISADIKKSFAKTQLPSGTSTAFSGDAEAMQDMFKDMLTAMFFAVLFVYMIMVSLFESYIHPFTIMFSIPVALVGALTALALTGQTLNMFSMIGILLSIGLVTKNAILLVDYTNTLRSQGRSVMDALLEAGPIRLRPILMTTMTMVFGMLPIALASGAGADMRKGMAIVIIGALISSTMLTLILVPVMYTYIEDFRNRKMKKKQSA